MYKVHIPMYKVPLSRYTYCRVMQHCILKDLNMTMQVHTYTLPHVHILKAFSINNVVLWPCPPNVNIMDLKQNKQKKTS